MSKPRVRFADLDKAYRCPMICHRSMAIAWEREYDEGKRSHLRFHRCPGCEVIVLPSVLRWIRPAWWRIYIRQTKDDLSMRVRWRIRDWRDKS